MPSVEGPPRSAPVMDIAPDLLPPRVELVVADPAKPVRYAAD
jgi:hypothetical protein